MIFHNKTFKIDEVLNHVEPYVYGHKKKKKNFGSLRVKVNSLRLNVFKEKGTTCSYCGVEGTHFKLQKTHENESFHFVLHTDDGIELTKDHIMPKSKGGSDELDNLQTLCGPCNFKKEIFMNFKQLFCFHIYELIDEKHLNKISIKNNYDHMMFSEYCYKHLAHTFKCVKCNKSKIDEVKVLINENHY